MKKLKFLFSTIFLMATLAASAGEAENLLGRIADNMASGTIDAAFTVTRDGSSNSGTIKLSGQCFYLHVGDLSCWFDGTTQWSLIASARECNITEPTTDELAEVNPLTIINSFRSGYTARLLQAPAGKKKLQLTARSSSAPIASAVLTVNASTLAPTDITVTPRGARPVTLRVTSFTKSTSATAVTAFRYNASRHPGVELIDLR